MNKFMYIAPLVLGLVAVAAPADSQAQQKAKVGSNLGTTPPKFGLLADVKKLTESMTHIIQETDAVAASVEADLPSQYESIKTFGDIMDNWIKACGAGSPNCDIGTDANPNKPVRELQTQFNSSLTDFQNNYNNLPKKEDLVAVIDALKAAVDKMDPADKEKLANALSKITTVRANLINNQITMQKLLPQIVKASNTPPTPPLKK